MIYNLGVIVPINKGLHDSTLAYKKMWQVKDDIGSWYRAKKEVPVDTALSNTEFWELYIDNSDTGTQSDMAEENTSSKAYVKNKLVFGTEHDQMARGDHVHENMGSFIITPTITVTDTTVTSSVYVSADTYTGVHTHSSWYAWDTAERTTLLDSSVKSDVNLLSWTPNAIPPETTAFIECLHISGDILSALSPQVILTTGAMSIETPTLVMDGTPSSLSFTPFILGGGFNVIGGEGTHTQTLVKITKTTDSSVIHEVTLGAVTSTTSTN